MSTEFHAAIQCHPLRLAYDFGARAGVLHIEDGGCCDMQGCIALFEHIDSGVCKIETFSGRNRDTDYHRIDGRWTAYPASFGRQERLAEPTSNAGPLEALAEFDAVTNRVLDLAEHGKLTDEQKNQLRKVLDDL